MRPKKTVDIAGMAYTIKLVKHLKAEKPGKTGQIEELLGSIDHDKREIRLEMGRSDMPWILFHELCHGALEAMDEMKLDNDEKFVKSFSRALFGAVKSAGMFKK